MKKLLIVVMVVVLLLGCRLKVALAEDSSWYRIDVLQKVLVELSLQVKASPCLYDQNIIMNNLAVLALERDELITKYVKEGK